MNEAACRRVIDGIARGEFGRPDALECQRLFDVEPDFLTRLTHDVRTLVTRNAPSDVASSANHSHWTKPYGKAVHFSLLNTSGDFGDTSTDHDWRSRGKRFHHAADYPAIAEFIALFPHAVSVRVMGMAPGAGLAPHKGLVSWQRGRRWYFMTRFMLPIATNPGCTMTLNGNTYHYEQGSIYLFNGGCVHTAANSGETQRYHLAWDMLLDEATVDLMFGDRPVPGLRRVHGADRHVVPLKSEPVGAFVIGGKVEKAYRALRLSALKIEPHEWQLMWTNARYLRYRLGHPAPAPLR
jgi:hypothetical protein